MGDLSEIRVGRQAAERRRLLRWVDNLDSDSRRLFSLRPESVETADLNGDGRVDLRIHLRLVEARLPERYPDLEQAVEAGYALPEGSLEILDFLQEPDGFVPAPTSWGRLSRLQELVRRVLE